jgi:hypothetical protein
MKENVSNAVNDYKIQIFSGESDKQNTLNQFRTKFSIDEWNYIFSHQIIKFG